MTLITAWTVSGVKVVVLGADDENLSYNYSLLGCLLCLKVQQKLHPCHSESHFFVLFVSILAFFLKA